MPDLLRSPPDDDLDLRALEAWLVDRLADDGVDAVRLAAPDRPEGGYSGDTLILPAVLFRDGWEVEETFVVRREPPEPAIYPAQSPAATVEVGLQWRVLRSLQDHSDLPVAPPIGFEPGMDVLGGPFFVTGFVAGDIPREDPAYVAEGFYAEATPERRRAMNEAAVRTIATVNRVDWMAAGLGDLVPEGFQPTNLRQLDLWEEFASVELRERPHPILTEGWRKLRADVPSDGPPALCWGDCRLGNIFWEDATPVCLTDFEGVAIAPAEFDLGWFLSFDRWIHEACGNPRLDGEPTREDLVGLYAEALGRRPEGVWWQEVFGAARYCTIVVRVINRLEERGALPTGSDLYLAGGVTECLRMLLDQQDPY